uniref:Resistance to inhibitors of cholinesterase protein 3 N-terminal domain-containing protein n=1 Tax=Electrophorus electricus TaxID=8005 RepID=A0A4W4GYX0_ELEEL
MSVSTFQKITFLSCLVLCVSLFLPKILFSTGKKDIVQSKVKGKTAVKHVKPTFHHVNTPYNPELVSKVTGSGKPPLLGQVIPVYGFGIFLYIIYIFFKVRIL